MNVDLNFHSGLAMVGTSPVTYDVIIIGGGLAGTSAAIYTARADLRTLVIDKGLTAGALGITGKITNYPGVPGPITGAELVETMRQQATSFGMVRDELLLIGLDQVAEYWPLTVLEEWKALRQPLAGYTRRSATELQAVVAHNGVLLDVRTPAEYAGGHIPGSRNIPLNHLAERLGELLVGRGVIVYCQGASRSPIAASIVQAHGVERRHRAERWI